jgi:hypothetical protein
MLACNDPHSTRHPLFWFWFWGCRVLWGGFGLISAFVYVTYTGLNAWKIFLLVVIAVAFVVCIMAFKHLFLQYKNHLQNSSHMNFTALKFTWAFWFLCCISSIAAIHTMRRTHVDFYIFCPIWALVISIGLTCITMGAENGSRNSYNITVEARHPLFIVLCQSMFSLCILWLTFLYSNHSVIVKDQWNHQQASLGITVAILLQIFTIDMILEWIPRWKGWVKKLSSTGCWVCGLFLILSWVIPTTCFSVIIHYEGAASTWFFNILLWNLISMAGISMIFIKTFVDTVF